MQFRVFPHFSISLLCWAVSSPQHHCPLLLKSVCCIARKPETTFSRLWFQVRVNQRGIPRRLKRQRNGEAASVGRRQTCALRQLLDLLQVTCFGAINSQAGWWQRLETNWCDCYQLKRPELPVFGDSGPLGQLLRSTLEAAALTFPCPPF